MRATSAFLLAFAFLALGMTYAHQDARTIAYDYQPGPTGTPTDILEPERTCASCHSPYHATAWALAATLRSTDEPTPTHPPTATATNEPYTVTPGTPPTSPFTRGDLIATWTAAAKTREASWTKTPTATMTAPPDPVFVVYLPRNRKPRR